MPSGLRVGPAGEGDLGDNATWQENDCTHFPGATKEVRGGHQDGLTSNSIGVCGCNCTRFRCSLLVSASIVAESWKLDIKSPLEKLISLKVAISFMPTMGPNFGHL